jgi:hypothetical protein
VIPLLLFGVISLQSVVAQEIYVFVTAYCPCEKCCGKPRWHPLYGITSTQKRVVGVPFRKTGGTPQYGIASDPGLVPYGSQIIFRGYKPSRYYPRDYAWPVDDTGGAMRRAARQGYIHLDFRFIHHNSALRWARRYGGWQWVTILP